MVYMVVDTDFNFGVHCLSGRRLVRVNLRPQKTPQKNVHRCLIIQETKMFAFITMLTTVNYCGDIQYDIYKL